MLLVVLGPANGEAIRGDAEDGSADGERDDEWVDDGGSERRARQALAPASASSTSVAWVTPVAPRAAYGVVFRK